MARRDDASSLRPHDPTDSTVDQAESEEVVDEAINLVAEAFGGLAHGNFASVSDAARGFSDSAALLRESADLIEEANAVPRAQRVKFANAARQRADTIDNVVSCTFVAPHGCTSEKQAMSNASGAIGKATAELIPHASRPQAKVRELTEEVAS